MPVFVAYAVILVGAGGLLMGVVTHLMLQEERQGIANFGASMRAVVPLVPTIVATATLAALGAMLGFVVFIIPGVMLMIGWVVAVPVAVDRGLGPIPAMRASWALTHGSKWQILGLSIVAWIVIGLVSMALLPLQLLSAGLMEEGNVVLAIAIESPLTVFKQVPWALVATAIYARLRRDTGPGEHDA